MTEDEGDLIHEALEDYWLDFSALIAETLKKAPPHLHAHLLMRLQEKSSVYGSCYKTYL